LSWGHFTRFWGQNNYPQWSGTRPASNFIEGLRDFAHLVTDLPQVTVVIRDPNDDMVIATAQRAQAAYIVTRDKDLLSLQHYEGIIMITPEAFIAIVRERW
jgi:predicted nucleic acid-binding protein